MPGFGEMAAPAWDPLFPGAAQGQVGPGGPSGKWGSFWVSPAPSLPPNPEPEQAAAEKCQGPDCLPPQPRLPVLLGLASRAGPGHACLTASPCASRLTRCRPSAGPALWEIFPSERQEPRHPWDLCWEAFPGLGLGLGLGAGSPAAVQVGRVEQRSHSQGCPALPRTESLATRIAVQVSKPGKFPGDSDLMPQDSSLGRELHPRRVSRALRQGSGCGHHASLPLGPLPGSPKGLPFPGGGSGCSADCGGEKQSWRVQLSPITESSFGGLRSGCPERRWPRQPGLD